MSGVRIKISTGFIACTCEGATMRPMWGVTTTEALGGVRSRTKTLCLGVAKCTRALCTVPICMMLRASSCSKAVLILTCSINWLVVMDDWSFRPSMPVVPALGALAVALLVWWRLPSPKDATLGQNGVGRGFEGRAWSELEEWRLTGEHLRFRLHGEWTSAPCPVDDQPRVRAWLVQRLSHTTMSPTFHLC